MLRPRCGLGMLHGTCEIVHGVLGRGNWECPIWCVLCRCPLILSPGLLRSTLSHIWCKLNLAMFLFSVGLLTLMHMDSLIVLAMLWSSLPIICMLSCVVMWPVVILWWCIGEGSFRCSLNLFQRSWTSLLYIPHHMQVLHIGTSSWPHFSSP